MVGLSALILIGRSSQSTDLNRPVYSDAVRNHEAVAHIKFLSVLGMFPLILSLNSFTSPFHKDLEVFDQDRPKKRPFRNP